MKKHRRTSLYTFERTLFCGVAAFVVVALALYIYFICVAITHVVARVETDHKITTTKSEITRLEERFINARNAVTLQTAVDNGFSPSMEKTYISRTVRTLVFSENDES